MNSLGMQVAFTLPLTLPLVIGIGTLRPAWFYPAFMISLGAHYLLFVFLYGRWQFGVLCAMLTSGGLVIAMYLPQPVSFGAWATAALLLPSPWPVVRLQVQAAKITVATYNLAGCPVQ